ncbi:MAG: hypothetical protein Q4B68_01500 [Bacteroidales bacterium]|nr:hypothetical protein [Bacteroidales bacterium]
MKRLKSFWSLMIAIAVTAFSAQAQEVVSQACAPVNQDAPVAKVVKAVKGETVTTSVDAKAQLKPVANYKPAAAEIAPAAAKSVKKVASKVASVNELEGNYVLTGTSLLTSGYNGVAVTITALGNDSIVIADFWSAGYGTEVKAKVDVATGKVTIPSQVMGQHGTYGDILFAKTDLSTGQPIADAAVEATIQDGVIAFANAWGAYVKASATATSWSYFSIVNAATLEKCNATFKGKKHSDGTFETYGVVMKQVGENVLEVKNLGNYGQTVKIDLNRNKTANIPSSLIAYNSTYGDFYSYNLKFTDTGASLSTDDAVTSVATDLKQLNWTNWGVVTGNAQGSRYLVAAYDECNLTGAVDIVYPTISVTDFEGEGTAENPYLIKSRDHLILLSDKVAEITELDCTTPPNTAQYCRAYLGKHFRVTNDIDMGGYKFTPIGDDWSHIFAGTFDGGNFTISNLVVDKKGAYAGLFGRADTVSVIKNVKIDNASINCENSQAAAIVGWTLGNIENVSVTNSTISATGYGVAAVAGIGQSVVNAAVENCQIKGLYGYTGGVIGEAHGPVVNCYAKKVKMQTAGVSSSSPGMPVGGVAGNLYLTSMENCWFSGIIDANSLTSQYQTVGGLAGWATGATIKNSFAVGQLSGYASGAIVGGLVGFLRGDIENCHFNGRVEAMASRSTGGAVGRIMDYRITSDDPIVASRLTNVYSAGTVVAETYQYQSQTEVQNNEIIGTIADGSNPALTNVYFDKQVVNITKSGYGVNTEDLVGANGPAGFDAQKWAFTAGRYPVLKSFAALDAAKLAGAAVVMPQGATFDKFTKNAAVNADPSVAVGFYKEGNLYLKGYYASISNGQIVLNEESAFGNDTIFFTNAVGNYYRIMKVAPMPYEGAGTAEEPYLIKTKADLILLSQLTTVKKQLFPDTYFKIANDIDLELDEAFLGICSDADDAHNYFSGHLDGDGHFIHKMKFNNVVWSTPGTETTWGTINTSASKGYKGLVGRLAADGSVKNVNIAADCDLHFYASSGAVVGYSSGVVENCRNYADVMGNSCWIGGVVGQNLKDGKMKDCFNAGNVVGGYGQTGGIVGANTGLIENAMNVGRIEIRQLATNYATQLQSAGGISGTSSSGGKFVNCVNAGTVTAQIKRAGGITGYWGPVAATSTTSYYRNDMINCVNFGTAYSPDAATNGAMAGGESQSTSEEISGNYWDVQILDIPADANAPHAGMNGVETSVLTSGTALEGFDTNIWKFEAGKYPVLKAFADEPMVQAAAAAKVMIPTGVTVKNLTADATITGATASLAQGTKFALEGNVLKGIPSTEEVVNDTLTIVSGDFVKIITISALPTNPLQGSGTAEDPWRITTPAEWNALANFMSKTANTLEGEYVAVMNDIDFANHNEDIIPLGADGVTAFAGNLDGKNFSVKGYEHTTKIAGEGALFGTIAADAVVSNITAAGNITGGLGGAKGTTKLGYVGGVVGKLYGTLNNVKNTGKVTGIATYSAGIAAYVYQGATLNECVNDGEIASAAAYCGGIAGYVYETSVFNKCVNNGKVSSTVAAGYCAGIAAGALPATFSECVNNGEILAGSSAGIVANCAGKAGGFTYVFDRCVNNGEVKGNAILGGITALQGTTAGNNVCHYIECVNNADITATATAAVSSSSMAGIAAFYSPGSVFDHCVNTGYITNTKSVYTAGIAGYYKGSANATYPVEFKGCVNKGNITSAAQQIAGIVAYVSNYVTIDSCVNKGDIEQGLWGAAGICYTFTGANSVLTNCINFGNVTVAQYNAGGIVGNNANASSIIEGCVNIGNIATTSTAATNNYGVGGIAGGAYANLTNCFNAGNITGQVRVGGIVGSPSYYATAVRTRLTNCVNIGSISAKEGCGGALVGTEAGNEAKYWGDNNTCENSYYLSDMSHLGEGASCGDYNLIGTGLSVNELVNTDLNPVVGGMGAPADGTPAWVGAEYAFQVPAIAVNEGRVQAHAAAVVLAEGDSFACVQKNKFNVGTPANVEWYPSSEIVVIEGNNVTVTEPCEVAVVLTAMGYDDDQEDEVLWHLNLKVEEGPTGVNDVDAKTVLSEAYYTVAGVKVEKPAKADGQLYIIVRKYTDGTMKAIKLRN